jgi:hypothetical protein
VIRLLLGTGPAPCERGSGVIEFDPLSRTRQGAWTLSAIRPCALPSVLVFGHCDCNMCSGFQITSRRFTNLRSRPKAAAEVPRPSQPHQNRNAETPRASPNVVRSKSVRIANLQSIVVEAYIKANGVRKQHDHATRESITEWVLVAIDGVGLARCNVRVVWTREQTVAQATT